MSALAEPVTSRDVDALLRGSPRPQGRELANRRALSAETVDPGLTEAIRAELLTQLAETQAEMVPWPTGGGGGKRARRAERRRARLTEALAELRLGDGDEAPGPTVESGGEDRESEETVRLIEAAFSAAPAHPAAEAAPDKRPPLPAAAGDRRALAAGAADSQTCRERRGRGAERLLLLTLGGVNGAGVLYLALAHPFAAQVVVLALCVWVLRTALARLGSSPVR